MTKTRKQWHVQVGTTVHTFSTRRAAKAFASHDAGRRQGGMGFLVEVAETPARASAGSHPALMRQTSKGER